MAKDVARAAFVVACSASCCAARAACQARVCWASAKRSDCSARPTLSRAACAAACAWPDQPRASAANSAARAADPTAR
ncbi:hypothetical protein [Corynebacterium bovis]|uniref:hypothetical protein n=1 Tax=Corynebacterium bovis TaxID=36808 RepID=UPI000F63A978|nr:hypothetical protein [Corynebacterium bovis]